MKVLSRADLREKKGIRFSRQHLYRLIRQRKFPSPIKIGANSNAWVEAEIDEFIANCVAQRDDATAA
jgi:prophage regulatory protein